MICRSDPYILAIDPGNKQTAFCLLSPDLRPLNFAKQENEFAYCSMVEAVAQYELLPDNMIVVIEWMQNYGSAVGQEVFRTIEWIGVLKERFSKAKYPVAEIVRSQEKMTICHSLKANDATIRQALIDRFAYGVPNYGKGSKKEPGWFYGFRADIWQAYAIGITYHDLFLDRR